MSVTRRSAPVAARIRGARRTPAGDGSGREEHELRLGLVLARQLPRGRARAESAVGAQRGRAGRVGTDDLEEPPPLPPIERPVAHLDAFRDVWLRFDLDEARGLQHQFSDLDRGQAGVERTVDRVGLALRSRPPLANRLRVRHLRRPARGQGQPRPLARDALVRGGHVSRVGVVPDEVATCTAPPRRPSNPNPYRGREPGRRGTCTDGSTARGARPGRARGAPLASPARRGAPTRRSLLP